jgi:hypothetical protein
MFGGQPPIVFDPRNLPALTEAYDGTSWTAGGNLNTPRKALAGAGTQTAALGFGGSVPPNTGATELYDGTSWTSSPASLATARDILSGGAGTQTSALAAGGGTNTGALAATEECTGVAPTTVTITAS